VVKRASPPFVTEDFDARIGKEASNCGLGAAGSTGPAGRREPAGRAAHPSCEEAKHRMKGYATALCLPLLLGAAAAANATTAVIDFNTPSMTTANTLLLANAPNGAVTMTNVAGRNAVQTGGTSDNEFLYIGLPKGLFKNSKSVWAVVDYYDQGTDQFQLHYDSNGSDTPSMENAITKHDTGAWTTHTFKMPQFGFTEGGPGGADVWIDDMADGPEIISKITVTDQDPDLTHFPHVDPAHPITIGAFDKAAWAGAYTVTLDSAAQDALAGANWGGPQDFSGTYYHKWDEQNLYIRGDVIDATPRKNDKTGNSAWAGDGIEEFLSLDWSDPTHTTYLDNTDFHVFIGLGDSPQWGVEWSAGTDDLGAIPTSNLAIKNTTNPTGYQFELALPWKLLLDDVQNTTTKITAGQKIGWFMFANNSKDVPSSQQVAMSPFKRTHPSGDPSVWATVVLEPFQAQPVTPAPAPGQ
jgi:hypothetical protein